MSTISNIHLTEAADSTGGNLSPSLCSTWEEKYEESQNQYAWQILENDKLTAENARLEESLGAISYASIKIQRENAKLKDDLRKISMADHPLITDMDNAEELGRRLTTAAQIAREAISLSNDKIHP